MVVITLKNLRHDTFSIEIELSETVRALKEKIEKEKGADFPAADQKLIYAGKILEDESTLESYNITDKRYVVIIVKNTKAATPPPDPSDPTVATEEQESSTGAATSESTPAPQPSVGETVGSA